MLVADDNSPDGTGEIADELATADDHVHVMHRPGKKGLGAAYLAGFAWALERDYDVVVEMDADGSHRPEDLPRLLTALENADLVLGSRWVQGGSVVNWPAHRKLLSRAATPTPGWPSACRSATSPAATGRSDGRPSSSWTCTTSRPPGYCFQVDLAWRAQKAGLRVVEVPITFVEREYGTSKMSGSIVAEALWRVTQWGVASRVKKLRRSG